MGKCRIKRATKVLEKIKTQFPETVQFINDCLEQECLKENMSVDEVIFLFTFLEAKSSRRKIFFIWIGFSKSL